MRLVFFFLCGILIYPSLLIAEQPDSEKSQSGCTCAGLIACEVAECAHIVFGIECATDEGRYDAICACQTGWLMRRCTNWDEIFNEPECAHQKQIYDSYGGTCSAS